MIKNKNGCGESHLPFVQYNKCGYIDRPMLTDHDVANGPVFQHVYVAYRPS